MLCFVALGLTGYFGTQYIAELVSDIEKGSRTIVGGEPSIEGEPSILEAIDTALGVEPGVPSGSIPIDNDFQAEQIIRTINQAQEDYFREHQTFADAQYPVDQSYFVYTYASTTFPDFAVSGAVQPPGTYRTYVSAVQATEETATGEYTFSTLICETEEYPRIESLNIYKENGVPICPQGFQQLTE